MSLVPLRVSRFTLTATYFRGDMPRGDQWVPELWRILDLCADAEQRACTVRGKDRSEAALVSIEVFFNADWSDAIVNTPIIGPLTARYPALIRSLRRVSITFNNYDESADLGALATLTSHLRELNLSCGGTMSLCGLEGRCEALRRVDISGCSWTSISSVQELLTCRALTMVVLGGCHNLPSHLGLPAGVVVR